MAHRVYIAFGTNLGDRSTNLMAAQTLLAQAGIKLRGASKVYETAPWGVTDQPYFLNQVLAVDTNLSSQDLLKLFKEIEYRLGRRAGGVRYGPRPIDLDILLYDDLILDTPDLVIPHPRLAERAFVLVPLADLAPDLVHPVLHKTIRELLAGLDTGGVARYRPPVEEI